MPLAFIQFIVGIKGCIGIGIVLELDLYLELALQQNFGQSLMTIVKRQEDDSAELWAVCDVTL